MIRQLEAHRGDWPRRAGHVIAAVAGMAPLLALDGVLWPLSFASRRAIAVAIVLGLSVAVSGACDRRQLGRWAAVLLTLALLARAPSVPISIVGFVLAHRSDPVAGLRRHTVLARRHRGDDGVSDLRCHPLRNGPRAAARPDSWRDCSASLRLHRTRTQRAGPLELLRARGAGNRTGDVVLARELPAARWFCACGHRFRAPTPLVRFAAGVHP